METKSIEASKLAQKLDTIEQLLILMTDEITLRASSEHFIQEIWRLRGELNLHRVNGIIPE